MYTGNSCEFLEHFPVVFLCTRTSFLDIFSREMNPFHVAGTWWITLTCATRYRLTPLHINRYFRVRIDPFIKRAICFWVNILFFNVKYALDCECSSWMGGLMELCGAIYLCVILNFPFYYVSSQRDPYTTSFHKRKFDMGK